MSIKSSVANFILPQNYYLTRFFYTTAFRMRNRGKSPLLIYQMGKVGSSTVVATLENLHLATPIYHIHSLTSASIADDERFYFGENRGWLRPSGWPNTVHLFTSYYLQAQLRRMKSHEKWKVITLVREPVARNVSGFFESIEYRIPNFYKRVAQGELSLSNLVTHFVDHYDNHPIPLRWFDDEMKAALHIDVFSKPFPRDQGYEIFASPQVDVLLLRLESLHNCYAEALRRFLGLEGVQLVTANDARDKAYYATYQDFVKSAALPASYLDRMYDSKYTRHFYSAAEIETYRAKWSGQMP